MDVYKHKEHTVWKLSKKVYLFKIHTKILFWHRGKLVDNFRFNIRPNKQWKYFHWFIRQPFFYFERNNGGFYIGTPQRYFHFQKKFL